MGPPCTRRHEVDDLRLHRLVDTRGGRSVERAASDEPLARPRHTRQAGRRARDGARRDRRQDNHRGGRVGRYRHGPHSGGPRVRGRNRPDDTARDRVRPPTAFRCGIARQGAAGNSREASRLEPLHTRRLSRARRHTLRSLRRSGGQPDGEPSMTNSLCFVLMPFNKKQDSSGVMIDFDAVYDQLIAPAIEEAGLVPVRADKEMAGGIIHKPMFERLIICDFAVADLTSANANVFYELGIRHAIKPYSTVLVFYSDGSRLPFDVSLLRGLPYKLNSAGVPTDVESDKAALVKRLLDARQAITELPSVDSPIFQLVEGFPNVDQLKTDVFHDLVRSSNDLKKRLDA